MPPKDATFNLAFRLNENTTYGDCAAGIKSDFISAAER